MKNIKRIKTRLACALLCACLLCTLMLASCNGTDNANSSDATRTDVANVKVVRATKDIAMGDKISEEQVEEVEIPVTSSWAGALENTLDVVGKYATYDIEEGDIIVPRSLSESRVEKNEDATLLDRDFGFEDLGYVVVTEFLEAGTGEDLSAKIQSIIDKNPHKVIYFPDGEYVIGSPIYTPGSGLLAVALKLSDGAVIKASDDWKRSDEAMIRMGGIQPEASTNVVGSNYYIEGGTIDGNGIADGISIDGGRETAIKNINVINTEVGVHIKVGVNSGSSDVRVENVTIVGNMSPSSKGILVDTLDNKIWNVRISNVQVGVELHKGGTFLRDVHVTYTGDESVASAHSTSYGFYDLYDRNWYDSCSSTDFAIAYNITDSRTIMTSCVARWTEAQSDCSKQVAISTSRALPGIIRSLAAYYTAPSDRCEYIITTAGGGGVIQDPIFDTNAVNSTLYRRYLKGEIHWNEED